MTEDRSKAKPLFKCKKKKQRITTFFNRHKFSQRLTKLNTDRSNDIKPLNLSKMVLVI